MSGSGNHSNLLTHILQFKKEFSQQLLSKNHHSPSAVTSLLSQTHRLSQNQLFTLEAKNIIWDEHSVAEVLEHEEILSNDDS